MPRVSADTIRKIREANDIVDVVGAHVNLQRSGSGFKGLCPFHQEKTPSFTVSQQRQTFKCFGCGVGGSVIDFVMEYEKLLFIEALGRLAERANIQIEHQEDGNLAELQRRKDRKTQLYEVMTWAQKEFSHNLSQANASKIAQDYLSKRGLNQTQLQKWGIGYSPEEFQAFFTSASKRFRDGRLLEEAGLVRSNEHGQTYSFFRGRIMFPIHDIQGRTVAFGGRKLREEQGGGKYINSPMTPIYDKSRVLYGIHLLARSSFNRARPQGKKLVVVVEGYLDVIACHEAGIDCAVAPCGTSLTSEQLRTLSRFGDRLILVMDGDSAGQSAMERILPEVLSQGLNVSAAVLPTGHDPDTFLKEHSTEAFLEALEKSRDLFHFKLQALAQRYDLERPALKSRAIEEVLQIVAEAQNQILRDLLLRQVSDFFRLPLESIHKTFLRRKAPLAQTQAQASLQAAPVKVELAEKILLVRLLAHQSLIQPVSSFVELQDFSSSTAQEVYRAILNAYDSHGHFEVTHILDFVPEDQPEARKLCVEILEGEISLASYTLKTPEKKSNTKTKATPPAFQNLEPEAFDLMKSVEEIRNWQKKRRSKQTKSAPPGKLDFDNAQQKLSELRMRKQASKKKTLKRPT